jgi:hypothetical protein
MTIGGLSLILIRGIINFLFLLFQMASGLRWIKVRIGLHKKAGVALFILATLHGLLGLLAQ